MLKRLRRLLLGSSSETPAPREQAVRSALARLRRSSNGVALVFTDIVESTALLTQIGDVRWSQILDRHLARCSALAAKHRGVQIDTTGDGGLCAFARVADGLGFAQALQANPGDGLISVRAGIHFGDVYVRDVGACGQLVHFGARVIGHGKGAEIWLSDPARSQLVSEAADLVRGVSWSCDERCRLKGIPGLHTLWRAA
jgi:class 3 adenylate cyclase